MGILTTELSTRTRWHCACGVSSGYEYLPKLGCVLFNFVENIPVFLCVGFRVPLSE